MLKFIILAMLSASAAYAQDPATDDARPTEVISGASNPEQIPDWVTLHSVMTAATMAEAKYGQDALAKFAKLAGMSEGGVRSMAAYHKEQETLGRADDRVRKGLCAARAQLQTREMLNAEIARLNEADREHTRRRSEGVYTLLSVEDAAKLRAYAARLKSTTNLIKSSDAVDRPAEYLSQLCGGVS